MAIGADGRVAEECGPVIIVPLWGMLAGVGIEAGRAIRAAAGGQERT
jgi:hypothetical protein